MAIGVPKYTKAFSLEPYPCPGTYDGSRKGLHKRRLEFMKIVKPVGMPVYVGSEDEALHRRWDLRMEYAVRTPVYTRRCLCSALFVCSRLGGA